MHRKVVFLPSTTDENPSNNHNSLSSAVPMGSYWGCGAPHAGICLWVGRASVQSIILEYGHAGVSKAFMMTVVRVGQVGNTEANSFLISVGTVELAPC